MVDEARFERVYAAHGSTVLRYCAYSLGSRDAAEDAAAEVFARYLERGSRLDEDRVLGWLLRVARNLCATEHRKTMRQRLLVAELQAASPAPEAWSDSDWWIALCSELTERDRLIVYLRAIEDQPFAEVARISGRSESAVKMSFYRAMQKLRSRYAHTSTIGQSLASGGVCNE